jgi:DNA-binding MarR family transcriptional regulator
MSEPVKLNEFLADDRQVLSAALTFLDAFRDIREDIPATHIYSFLQVALEEGLGVHDYAQRVGMPSTTMTRHLLDLGTMTRKRKPGLGLLIQRMDPMDMRRHQTFLTPEGRALMHKVIRIMKHGRAFSPS